MKRKPGFILERIGEESYAVAVTTDAARVGSMIRLNPTGAFLFAYLEEERTQDECIEALLGQYEIERSVAEADVARFLAGLSEAKLLAE